jgi:hypothetical protein
MHLAGAEQKTGTFRLNRLDGGGTIETSLRYSESRALCGAAAGLAGAPSPAAGLTAM